MAEFDVFDMPQRSPAWFQARIGLLTGSCADAVLAERKRGTGELAVRADLRRRLVCERITGLAVDEVPFLPAHMQRGQDLEPMAFGAYEALTGQVAERVGFVAHRTQKVGCSPDGHVGNWAGLIELKCPKSPTHLGYLQAGLVPEEYHAQILHGLWLTGAAWCDFCSYDDRFPAPLELFRVRVNRDDVAVAAYEVKVMQFLDEVERDLRAVLQRAEVAVA